MGHTIPAKRQIIYAKLDDLRRFCSVLREPERSRMLLLVNSAYQNISSIVYTNSLDDETMIVYAMLVKASEGTSWHRRDTLLRCLALLLSSR